MAESRRVDVIVPGHYEVRLRKGGPPVGARIAFMAPDDPITGEPLDRSYRHRLWIGGREVQNDGTPSGVNPATGRWRRGFLDVLWNTALHCTPIDETRYRYLVSVHEWAVQHAPHRPEANPRQRVNLGEAAPLY